MSTSITGGNLAASRTPGARIPTSGSSTPTTSVQQILGAEINAQSGDYTLVLTDAFKTIEMSKATALTLTIPLSATVAFPVGTKIPIRRTGAGILTIAITATGTLTGSSGALTDAGLNVEMILEKTASDTWLLQNGTPGTYIDYTPTWTGVAPLPTGIVARYSLIGKTCHVKIFMSGAGTSTATTKSVTLPFSGFTSTIGQSGLINIVQDAGTIQSTPGVINLPSGTNVASLFKTCNTGTAWTASGNWTVAINFVYEIQ